MSIPNPARLRSVEAPFEVVRSTGDTAPGDGLTLDGYAAVFDTDTEINSYEGHFVERVAPGAFSRSLRRSIPIMQFNHGRDSHFGQLPIGVYTDVSEDDHGLHVTGRLHDNHLVEPIRQAIESGAVTGMSFTFTVVRDSWTDSKGRTVRSDELPQLLYNDAGRGPLRRTIREANISEAGPVVRPAYATTSVGVRSTTSSNLSVDYARHVLAYVDLTSHRRNY